MTVPETIQYISPERLQTYYDILGANNLNTAKQAYHWNQLVCGTMYPVFQTLEITFRNALCVQAQNHHPRFNGEFWFQSLLNHVQDKEIQAMRQGKKSQWIHANKTRKRWTPDEKTIYNMRKNGKTAGDIVSSMNFGFWCKILDHRYEDITGKTLLWPNMGRHVFPNYPYNFNRQYIYTALNSARRLRNRIFHHEPAWKFPDRDDWDMYQSINHLNERYNQCLDIISWISPQTRNEFLQFGLHKNFKSLCTPTAFEQFTQN